jgi:release factor glutamine methyltransferase
MCQSRIRGRRSVPEEGGVEKASLMEVLARAGFVAPEAEAEALIAATSGGIRSLDELLTRRLAGEPLAWVTGSVLFCGLVVQVDRGVFVPRLHTEALAHRAAALLSDDGIAVDLCTGSGAVAMVMSAARPAAIVVATDSDPVAVACARRNGIEALEGDLDEPVPQWIRGRVDVMTAVVPYVPTEELHLLPRDVVAYEPRLALDGGPGGTALLMRAVEAAGRLLRAGGTVLFELGGDQADRVSATLFDAGFGEIAVIHDDDGRARAIEARRRP